MKSDCILRARRDVHWQVEADGWLAFDPLSRLSYRCGQVDRWLFDQLDGHQSLGDLARASSLRREYPAISGAELQALAETLVARGLVCQVSPPQAVSGRRRSSWLQWFSQSVSWRMRGIDPSAWLSGWASSSGMFFSAQAVCCWLVVSLVVGALVIADFQRLMEQADLWQWLMTPSSGSALLLIFLVTRGIHELGHAVALTRLGGRCPDIGVIFMLGAPCVYCDVTESWRLPAWQQRAAVAAGGMYAELIIASLAGLVWLGTAAGLVNTLALQTMVVCSVSTWLVNANPLMRFDGYFILSDWLGEANLRAKSDESCLRWLRRWLLGRREASPSQMAPWRQRALALFSLAGFLYRLSLSWMMAGVVVAVYTAWHFAWLGRVVAVVLLFCWWGLPAMRFWSHMMRRAQSSWARLRLGVLAAGIVLVIAIVPLPYRVQVTGWIQPERMQGLYAPAHARLIEVHKQTGAQVQPGEVVVQLDSRPVQLRALELQRAAEGAQIQLASWRQQQRRRDDLAIDLRALESTSRSAANQARRAEELVDQYQLRATMSGKLVSCSAPPLSDVDQHPLPIDARLWLDPQHQGRMVPAGTMLAAVCSWQNIAVLPLADAQLADVVVGSQVRLLLPSQGDRLFKGRVSQIVQLDQIDSLARLLHEARPTAHAQASPAHAAAGSPAAYAALVQLPYSQGYLNSSVYAVFEAPSRTLATHATSWARQNLRWLLP